MPNVNIDTTMLAGNSADGFNQEAGTATTISSTGITVGALATFLVVVFSWQASGINNPPTSISVTWNGVAMSQKALQSVNSGSTTETVAIYTLINPASGAKTLAASWTGSQDCYMSAGSFVNTDTVTGINAADTQTATNVTTLTIPSSVDGATVAVFVVNGAAPTVNFNKIFSDAPLNPGGGASYQLGGTSNAHTFTGAGGSAQALAGIHIIAGSAGSNPLGPHIVKSKGPGRGAIPALTVHSPQAFVPGPPVLDPIFLPPKIPLRLGRMRFMIDKTNSQGSNNPIVIANALIVRTLLGVGI